MKPSKAHILALSEALLVTFLWSTSYILVKMGLREINPLAFVTYRYVVASLVLALPMLGRFRSFLANLSLKRVSVFLLLGFSGYFVAQGLQILGLYYLQAVAVTFILNLTPIFVLVLGVFFLKEKPSPVQIIGIVLTLCGVLVFFANSVMVLGEVFGVVATFVSGFGWAIYMVVTRYWLRENVEIIPLTACSMALGAVMLLVITGLTGNVVQISVDGWALVLWLGIVNTALAFVLWNHSLKSLRAYEQSVIQNTMLIQIALLACVFLNEFLTLYKVLGIVLVFVGVLIVQLF